MANLINATPLYNFLKYCNMSGLNKKILDCGAGGKNPPLSLFYEHGYEVYGIEVCDDQIKKAKEFCEKSKFNLNIMKGDMIAIPFDEDTFSFLYSYNTSVHMKKKSFQSAVSEFHRVLKRGGLCYLNFLNSDCDTYNCGEDDGSGEIKVTEDGVDTIFSHYTLHEVEKLINGFEVIYEEKKTIKRIINGEEVRSGYYDYILKKI